MDGHLVTIEVGVECRTSKRVKLDCLSLYHLRLESLDTKPVKCRSSVQEYRMTFHHILKDIPDYRILPINDFLRRFHGLYNTTLNQLSDDEWFIKLSGHKLR